MKIDGMAVVASIDELDLLLIEIELLALKVSMQCRRLHFD
jgi:hypothetical protein